MSLYTDIYHIKILNNIKETCECFNAKIIKNKVFNF